MPPQSSPAEPSLREAALHALLQAEPLQKALATQALWARFEALGGQDEAALDASRAIPVPAAPLPGRPERPVLVPPMEVPHRSPYTPQGLAAMLHAIAHIEFNAINLALDAVWRFAGMPADYYRDWLRVAHEEAYHFGLVSELLQDLGHAYGDFPAHNGLWEMCMKTQDDVTARMALVPRTLEARGLDATPLIQHKLRQVNTPAALRAVAVLDIILRDEIGHVAVGNRWYGWLCQKQGLEPISHYRHLARTHQAPRLRPPFNLVARSAAGFTEPELTQLGEYQSPQ